MLKYRCTRKAFLHLEPGGPRLVKPGEVVVFNDWPGSALEPVTDEAKQVKAHYDAQKRRQGTVRGTPTEFLEAGTTNAAPQPAKPKGKGGRPPKAKTTAPAEPAADAA